MQGPAFLDLDSLHRLPLLPSFTVYVSTYTYSWSISIDRPLIEFENSETLGESPTVHSCNDMHTTFVSAPANHTIP